MEIGHGDVVEGFLAGSPVGVEILRGSYVWLPWAQSPAKIAIIRYDLRAFQRCCMLVAGQSLRACGFQVAGWLWCGRKSGSGKFPSAELVAK